MAVSTTIVAVLGLGVHALALSYLAARALLAVLTLGYARRTHGLRWGQLRLGSALFWSVGTGFLAVGARAAVEANGLLLLLFLGPLASVIFVAAMAGQGADWARAVVARLRVA
jgi:hypothetical protein